MAYQSLYRRYRPRRFSDVKDQEEVVRALRNAVRDDRVGHAYLFSGPRGTGKTSTARILAKALNCVDLQDGEPCGVCESCVAIDAGTSYDVQELDAASNNKVEEVRELISRVALGSPGRTKVYILDEVHMLTAAASAALLKTLEEPPDHVVFVLATTDPQKVLPTIRSRTQHYEFRLLGAEDLAAHVRWIIADAGLDLPEDAVEYVVRQGGGSARDTLSALERVAAAGGVVDEGESLTDLLDAVAAGDPGKALLAVSDAVSSGRDPRVLGEALLARLRDVFLQRMGAPLDHLPPAEVARVETWANQLGDRATTRALEAVGDALLEMRQAPDPRIPLEVALVKLSRVDGDASLDALAARVAALEKALASGAPVAVAPAAAPAPAPAAAPAAAPVAPEAPAAAPSGRTPIASRPPLAPVAPAAAPAPAAPAPDTGAEGPAAQVRAALAAQRAERAARGGGGAPAARPASAAPPPPGSTPPTAPPAAPPPAPTAPPATAVTPPVQPAPPEPAAPPPAATPAPAPAVAAPSTGSPAELWTGQVLPQLTGLAKGVYQSADLVSLDGGQAVVRVDNDHHQQGCERKRADVEKVLSDVVGQPVTITFQVADGGGSPARSMSGSGRTSAPVTDDPDEHLAGADVHDLDDAPDVPSGGIAALTEAFPGAELLEES
jgi:DNA polymerase-3 subunit gamma/tau